MRYFITAIAFIFIFSSCKDNSENSLTVFRENAENLERSNKNISNHTAFLYRSMEEKTVERISMFKALVWQPRALSIQKLSSEAINFINVLKGEIKKEAGFKSISEKVAWEADMNAANQVFYKNKRGEELYNKLVICRADMLAIDPQMKSQLKNDIEIISNFFDVDTVKQSEFTKTYFDHIPAIAAYSMLCKFENNLIIAENIFATYCDVNSTTVYDSVFFIVSFLPSGVINSTFIGT